MRSDLAHREADFFRYHTEDGRTPVDVRFDGDTTWLSLGQMAQGIKSTSGDAA